ncbi:MAG: RsmB/NOP family class I SAM-dependent RNA methyltransferase, partial [Acetobacteraceae bacterium]|nr:RsmB/NOP family class I SAM-dependent RNA methyltransferase [Acetobacteraceae bacterium]
LAVLEGGAPEGVSRLFSGGRFAPLALSAAEAAVLWRLAGHTLEHPEMPEAVLFEVPDWVLPKLKARFGLGLEAEMRAMLTPAPLDLRVNLLRGTRAQAKTELAHAGIGAEETRLSPWGLRVAGRRPVMTGATFHSGLVEIQDEGSQCIALLTEARPGMRVADLCAGAGGKTLALAMAMENRGHILACDVSPPRLESAVRRLRRAGVHNVERLVLSPGEKRLKRLAGSFDRVLVDAPCTGTGTWRRNPDARRRLKAGDLAELRVKQQEILDSAAKLVRIGGRLIYATCSMLTEENESQIAGFLDRHAGFAGVPVERAWPGAPPSPGNFLLLTPARHGTDGFFAAVLERLA